jgi:nucleotide-binding universal stress UspA family protein
VQHFKKLLVAIVPEVKEQSALRRAVQVAQHNHAGLDVIEVMEETPPNAGRLRQRLHVDGTVETSKRELERHWETLIAPLRATDLKMNIHVATGTPFLEIIRTVLRHRYDLVMKTIEPERGWQQVLWGSTDKHLLRKCPSALWLLQPTEPARYRRILVAIDPDMEDRGKRELATRLLHLGTSLAQSERAELLVGHAWSPFAETKLKYHLHTAEFGNYLRSCQQESTAKLRTFLSMARVNIPPERMRLAKGKADVVIPRLAKRHAVDLVVMGTIGRRGIPGLVIGNTAERLLNRLECSILTLKPPGFVSPVSL